MNENTTALPQPSPQAGMTVAEVLETWPQTLPVFLRFHTSCPGCSLAQFETLSDAARNYQLPLPEFLSALTQAAVSSPPPG